MKQLTRGAFIWLVIAMALAACAPAPTAGNPGKNDVAAAIPAATKRITTALRSVPASLVQQRTPRAPTVHGLDGIEKLTHAGLTCVKEDGTRAPQLAEAVPSLNNGLWKLLPDGRMETTWKIKPAARWQDGTPVSADDFLFTSAVEQDKDIEIPPIPLADRIQVLAALVHHQTENLAPLPLFYGAEPTLISNRLVNVHAKGDTFTQAWNVQEWDLKN